MRRNKHLLLWSSLATLFALGWAAYDETVLRDWRVAQAHVKSRLPPGQAKGFSVQLRQIVSPKTGATDRCTSCHVGMGPGETGLEGERIYGEHADVVHDPAQLGCTVCHAGQGLATLKDDAHGRVPHWPSPMIPKRYVYAGCGSCHAHLEIPNHTQLDKGRRLFAQHDCSACHRVDGRGGTLRPGGQGGVEGSDLSRVGASGLPKGWYAAHAAHRAKADKATAAQKIAGVPAKVWKASFGEVPSADRGPIETYLRSRVGAPGLVEAKALFHSLGCRGCHKVAGVGGDDGPELTVVGQKDPALLSWGEVKGARTLERWFKEHFRAPARLVAGSKMPALGLSEQQIDQLTYYMFSLRRTEFPEALWPKDRIRVERFGEREFAGDGASLYGAFCASCHGPSGEGMRYPGMVAFPAVANPDFLAVASDAQIAATIRLGRPGRRMPAWVRAEGGLSEADVTLLVAHLRRLGGKDGRLVAAPASRRPRRWAKGDLGHGRVLYRRSCASCHGERGEGVEGPALNNRVLLQSASDWYLFETIRRGRRGTSMPGFAAGSTTHRALSDADVEAVVVFVRSWERKR